MNKKQHHSRTILWLVICTIRACDFPNGYRRSSWVRIYSMNSHKHTTTQKPRWRARAHDMVYDLLGSRRFEFECTLHMYMDFNIDALYSLLSISYGVSNGYKWGNKEWKIFRTDQNILDGIIPRHLIIYARKYRHSLCYHQVRLLKSTIKAVWF